MFNGEPLRAYMSRVALSPDLMLVVSRPVDCLPSAPLLRANLDRSRPGSSLPMG